MKVGIFSYKTAPREKVRKRTPYSITNNKKKKGTKMKVLLGQPIHQK